LAHFQGGFEEPAQSFVWARFLVITIVSLLDTLVAYSNAAGFVSPRIPCLLAT
jgi:hypothetical protein